MGNFLITISSNESRARSDRLFRLGLTRARQIKSSTAGQILETVSANVAVFPRVNGTGGTIARDETTGSWLVACGSWFHTDGYAVGEEFRLLSRVSEVGVERLVQELEGFFVIAFGDSQAREVFLITDLMGSRHCFIRDFGDCQAISISSLLLASLDEAPLDRVACEEFLRTGIVYEDRTLFRDVKKLAPATIYRFADGKPVGSSLYWQLAHLDPYALTGSRATERLCETLVSSARRIGRAYSRPVCDLTGGYDSRAVVASFMCAGVGFETTVSGPADSPDVVISRRLAKIIGHPHWHIEPATPDATTQWDGIKNALTLTDGEYDLVEYARILAIHRRLSEKFDISVNGSYGEIARGYWWEILGATAGRKELVDAQMLARRRYAIGTGASQLFPSGESLEIARHLATIITHVNFDLARWPDTVQPNTVQMDNVYLMLRMQRWQGRIASSTDQIWPCLSLFLFRSVLETALQTDPQFRKRNRLVQSILSALQPDLAAEPLDAGYPPLPLTWKTLPRFLPAMPRFAGTVLQKAGSRLFRTASSRVANLEPVRLRLWRNPEIREILTPPTMRLNGLIETERLNSFLEASQQERFPFDAEWRRLLSLEMALRLLHRVNRFVTLNSENRQD